MTADSAMRFREFRMPDVGEGLTEAEILKWFVQPGDPVADGQVVCEVETAKAAVELPIPFDGVVHRLYVGEGSTVDVGTPIISVDTQPGAAGPEPGAAGPVAKPQTPPSAEAGSPSAGNGVQPAGDGDAVTAESSGRQPVLVGYGVSAGSTKRRPRKQPLAGLRQAGARPEPAAEAQPAVVPALSAAPQPGPSQPGPPQPGPPQPGAAGPGRELNGHSGSVPVASAGPVGGTRPLAKPPVRKLAKDLGVNLATAIPTGPGGVVTREDVYAAASAATQAEAVPVELAALPVQPQAVPAELGTGERERRIPIRGVRKMTAQAMVTSAFTAPHVTEFITVDVTRTMKLVEKLKRDPDMAGLRVNPLLLVAKAFLAAIRRHPEINAAWDEVNQEIVHKSYVHLGIATATPRGLIVPNIKDAHAKTLPQLAEALGELVATAREGKTSPAAMQGGTVTITNIGVFGVDTGTPILNPGESAILAVGAIRPQPWVHKGKIKPRQVTTLALSFDHRLVDGELGSRVLADIAAILEQPKRLITWS